MTSVKHEPFPPNNNTDHVVQSILQAKNYANLESLLSQHGLNLTHIENRLQKFGSEISSFNSSVSQQLSEVRKMAGPAGPPGPQGLKVKSLKSLN